MNKISNKNDKKNMEQCATDYVIQPKKQQCGKIANIVNFFVSSDSLVAKATLVTDGLQKYIEIDWGDGQTDVLNDRFSIPKFGVNNLPAGTYEFYHQYELGTFIDSRGGTDNLRPSPKEYTVSVIVIDNDGGFNEQQAPVNIIPKYKINYYRLYVGLKSGCDPFYEHSNEFDIKQTLDGEVIMEFDTWHPSNDFFFDEPYFSLKGSEASFEFEISDILAQPTRLMKFHFVENDPISNDLVTIAIPIYQYKFDIESYVRHRLEGVKSNDGCQIMYAIDYEVKLLIPLPQNPNVAISAI